MRPLLRTTLLLLALSCAATAGVLALAGPSWIGLAIGIGTVFGLAVVPAAGALLRRLHGARPLDGTSAPGIARLVGDLADVAGMPTPRLWLVDDGAPAAFSTGLVPQRASIVLTTGLLALLSERELRAVLAHELAHIRRHDTGIATLCVAGVGVLPMLVLSLLGLEFFDDESADDTAAPWWVGAVLAPVVGWALGRLLHADRDFDADRLAARWCGEPGALADALARIERAATRQPLRASARHPQAGRLLTVPSGSSDGPAGSSTALRIERLLAQAQTQRAQV